MTCQHLDTVFLEQMQVRMLGGTLKTTNPRRGNKAAVTLKQSNVVCMSVKALRTHFKVRG